MRRRSSRSRRRRMCVKDEEQPGEYLYSNADHKK
jgi:hypothetical protein